MFIYQKTFNVLSATPSALSLVLDTQSKSKLLYDWWSVGQSVCLGIEHPCGTCDQILLPVRMLLSEICSLVSVGRPLWREDGSAVCSVITQWSESRRTRNHTLLSHLRLSQPRGKVEVEATLRLTVSQSVCLGNEHPCGTCDQILLSVRRLFFESCCLVSVGRPLWREVGSVICHSQSIVISNLSVFT
jgi:hypothetical protein